MKHISKAVAGSHYSEAVSNRGQRPRLTTIAKIAAWMAVPCLIMLLSACSASKHIQTIPLETFHDHQVHDTIFLHNIQYDSIYVALDHYIDRSRDTILIKDKLIEYRYRLLRDTIFVKQIEIKHDSIPYEVRITETIEVPRKLTWYDHATRATFWLLIGFLFIWLYRKLHKP